MYSTTKMITEFHDQNVQLNICKIRDCGEYVFDYAELYTEGCERTTVLTKNDLASIQRILNEEEFKSCI